MDRNYWQEYWDNYYKFMAVYLREVQEAYPDVDIKSEYTEVASLFEPVMPLEEYQTYELYDNDDGDNNSEMDDDLLLISPASGASAAPFIFPGGTDFISSAIHTTWWRTKPSTFHITWRWSIHYK